MNTTYNRFILVIVYIIDNNQYESIVCGILLFIQVLMEHADLPVELKGKYCAFA